MVFDGILISFVIGFLRRGTLQGFVDLKIKFGWVFPLLLVIQLVIFSNQNHSDVIGAISGYIFIAVYLIGLSLLWLNRELKGMNLVIIGVALNFFVMALNGGRMPVSLEAAAFLDPVYGQALMEGLYAKHVALTESTRLGFLGDIIPLSSPYPRQQVISIGDIIMNIGIFLFIQDVMMKYRKAQAIPQT